MERSPSVASSSTSSNQEQAVLHKRPAEHSDSLADATATKRPRTQYLATYLASNTLTELRLLHSQGEYHYLEIQRVSISAKFKNYQSYKFLDPTKYYQYVTFDSILDDCLEPATFLRVMELLVDISADKQPDAVPEPSISTLIPTVSDVGSLAVSQDYLPRMIEAAKRAQQYVSKFERAADAARLRFMLSLITLHITLEHGIAVRLREAHPEWPKRQIKTEKWKLFYNQLGGEQGLGCKLKKLEDNVSYGKILWTWAKDCGIMWLAVFACTDRGTIAFVKKNPLKSRNSEVVGSQLAMRDSWIAFSQALAPSLVNLLFGPVSPLLSMQHLSRLYTMQPNGCDSAAKFQRALWHAGHRNIVQKWQIESAAILDLEEAEHATIFDAIRVPIPEVPGSIISLSDSPKIDLIAWVFNATPHDLIELKTKRGDNADPVLLHTIELACLFSPCLITSSVFSFLAQLWDSAGINGWCCVSLAEGEDIMNSDGKCSVRKAIAGVLHSSSSYKDTKFLLIPRETDVTYYLYVCNLDEKKIQILYLPGTTGHAITIKEQYEVWINYPWY